jgi:Zn-dependent M28 family amino/carboxypeptidase
MTHRFILLLLLSASSLAPVITGAQTATASRTRAHVEFLASPTLEGRGAGSAGERLAAEYLVAQLTRIGAVPLPGRQDMFQPFEFTAGSRDGGSVLTMERGGGQPGTARSANIQALSFSDDATVTGAIVFAGYGIVVPESQNLPYDSYAGLDVTDKIVLVLRYFPEDADEKTRAILVRYADLRYKAMAARQRGAKALLVVTGPRSPNAGEFVPMNFDTALAGSGIPAASMRGADADALFALAAAKPLRETQEALDSGNPHISGFALAGVTASVKTAVVRERRTARNVVAYLPATQRNQIPNPKSQIPNLEKPWVAVGAHYDHLGRGGSGNSLASQADANAIHHGADDNASGTAAVLAIADALTQFAQPRRRDVIIAFWSAEEIGLVGSNSFVTKPPVRIEEIAAYFNFDMVGRMQDNRLVVQATGSSPVWGRLLERANVTAGFDLVAQPDPYQPTDVMNFNQAGVPSLAFFTGAHSDYHKPSDTADKINYEDLDRVVMMAASLIRVVADADEAPMFTKVDQPAARGSLAGVRVTTGTIPDYATEVKGLLLSGVVGGGPAERAGLTKGDIIVEIAGRTIANIYDYTYALELLRVNQPVRVVYLRNGERRETQLTPAARP